MSQNIEDRRKKWPMFSDTYTVADEIVDAKKVWEPKSDYEKGGKYTKIQAWTWRGGQSVEVDNTPEGERIRVIHPKGSYVEMQSNGDVIFRSENDNYEVVHGKKNLRVRGDVHIQVDGDAKIKVLGNVTTEVGGNLNEKVAGEWVVQAENITFKMGTMRFEGDRVEHDDINIGKDHKHRDVTVGSALTGIPTE